MERPQLEDEPDAKKSKTETDSSCVICKADVEVGIGQTVTLKCCAIGTMHSKCLSDWLFAEKSMSNSCPYCRKRMASCVDEDCDSEAKDFILEKIKRIKSRGSCDKLLDELGSVILFDNDIVDALEKRIEDWDASLLERILPLLDLRTEKVFVDNNQEYKYINPATKKILGITNNIQTVGYQFKFLQQCVQDGLITDSFTTRENIQIIAQARKSCICKPALFKKYMQSIAKNIRRQRELSLMILVDLEVYPDDYKVICLYVGHVLFTLVDEINFPNRVVTGLGLENETLTDDETLKANIAIMNVPISAKMFWTTAIAKTKSKPMFLAILQRLQSHYSDILKWNSDYYHALRESLDLKDEEHLDRVFKILYPDPERHWLGYPDGFRIFEAVCKTRRELFLKFVPPELPMLAEFNVFMASLGLYGIEFTDELFGKRSLNNDFAKLLQERHDSDLKIIIPQYEKKIRRCEKEVAKVKKMRNMQQEICKKYTKVYGEIMGDKTQQLNLKSRTHLMEQHTSKKLEEAKAHLDGELKKLEFMVKMIKKYS